MSDFGTLGMVPALQRIWHGMTPAFLVSSMSSSRMRFAVDGTHPTGSVHHQKIAVIDDVLAFCGGLDFTIARWDTTEHGHHNRSRRAVGVLPPSARSGGRGGRCRRARPW